MQTSTLRPGLLVSLKTSVRGNINYERNDLEPEHLLEDGSKLARWETLKTIADPDEYETAIKLRSRARTIIVGVCAKSIFGLLCPDGSIQDLETAIAEARKLTDEFNTTAKLTRISLLVLVGKIVPDDVEAVRAINGEVRNLLADMAEGIRNLDVKAVREAADKARDIGRMLAPHTQARVQTAIEAARGAAREIVKAGEWAAKEIDRATIRKFTEARTAFLDLDQATEVVTPGTPACAVDLEPVAEQVDQPTSPAQPAPAVPGVGVNRSTNTEAAIREFMAVLYHT